MELDAMIEMADTYEEAQNQLPTTTKTVILSAIDGAPTSSSQATHHTNLSEMQQKIDSLEEQLRKIDSNQTNEHPRDKKENPFFKTGFTKRENSLNRRSSSLQNNKDKAKIYTDKVQEHRDRRRDKSREIMDKIRQKSRERSRARSMEIDSQYPNSQPADTQSTQLSTQQSTQLQTPAQRPQNTVYPNQFNFSNSQSQNTGYHPQNFSQSQPQYIDPAKTGFNYRAKSLDRNTQSQSQQNMPQPLVPYNQRSDSRNRNNSDQSYYPQNYHQIDQQRRNSLNRQQPQGQYYRSNSYNRQPYQNQYGRPQSQERYGYSRGNSSNRNPQYSYYRGNNFQIYPRSYSQERNYRNGYPNQGRPQSQDRFQRNRSQSPRVHFGVRQQMNPAYSKENFDSRQTQKHFSNVQLDHKGDIITFDINKEKYIFCRDCRSAYINQHICPADSKN